jgi:hypothetical protein
VYGILLREPTEDFRDPLNDTPQSDGFADNGGSKGHAFGCSGIDGVTFGTIPGDTSGKMYMMVAYGVYGHGSVAGWDDRYDNDYNVIHCYDPAEFDGIDILSGKHSEVYSQYECGEKACYMVAAENDKLIYSRQHDKYAYFDECPEHVNKFDEGGERVEYLKALLDAHMAEDKCDIAKNPNKKAGGGAKGKKIQDFGNGRMDHIFRADEEAARIPEGYRIDLRRFEGETLE